MKFPQFTAIFALLLAPLCSGCDGDFFQPSGARSLPEEFEDTSSSEDEGEIGIGDTVPDLTIPKLLKSDGRDSVSLNELRGSTVVLEFWATWCPPCRKAIPHLNELVDEFAADDTVRFISVSDETEAEVQDFMQTHPMHAWVGVDPSATLQQAFGVNAIPKTFVINPEGQVVNVLHPTELDARLIRLAGEAIVSK